jgi:hypothetical protein
MSDEHVLLHPAYTQRKSLVETVQTGREAPNLTHTGTQRGRPHSTSLPYDLKYYVYNTTSQRSAELPLNTSISKPGTPVPAELLTRAWQ